MSKQTPTSKKDDNADNSSSWYGWAALGVGAVAAVGAAYMYSNSNNSKQNENVHQDYASKNYQEEEEEIYKPQSVSHFNTKCKQVLGMTWTQARNQLQPNDHTSTMKRQVWQKLHGQIQQVFNTNKIMNQGSLDKGTQLADSDMDMVVFVNLDKEEEQMEIKEVMFNWRNKFCDIARHNFADMQVKKQQPQFMTNLCDLTFCNIEFQIAFVPANLRFQQLLFWKQCKNKQLRLMLSPVFCKNRSEYVGKLPPNVKSVIRIVKHWNKMHKIGMKSYAIELLVADIHSDNESISDKDLFLETLHHMATNNLVQHDCNHVDENAEIYNGKLDEDLMESVAAMHYNLLTLE